ncbi:hypothetical protein PM082_004735 [Marasmius tenuissimus]|nr:hypothetical protein PM082_004735 [Marasmius tenuissimus]
MSWFNHASKKFRASGSQPTQTPDEFKIQRALDSANAGKPIMTYNPDTKMIQKWQRQDVEINGQIRPASAQNFIDDFKKPPQKRTLDHPICYVDGPLQDHVGPFLILLRKTVHQVKYDIFVCQTNGCPVAWVLPKLSAGYQGLPCHPGHLPVNDSGRFEEIQEEVSEPGPSMPTILPAQQHVTNEHGSLKRKQPDSQLAVAQPVMTRHQSEGEHGGPNMFSPSVANARAQYDKELVRNMVDFEGTNAGEYPRYDHPAYFEGECSVLDPYDSHKFPNRVGSNGCRWELIYPSFDAFGQVIRAFCSQAGVPAHSVHALIEDAVLCHICLCVFTNEGHSIHLVGDQCGNCESKEEVVRETILSEPKVSLRRYPCDLQSNKSHAKRFEFTARSRVSVAFIEYHSKLGVPQDVWAVIKSAWYVCRVCKLARVFSEHQLHLDNSGDCTDPCKTYRYKYEYFDVSVIFSS